jgi:hypothetical protein
MPVSLGVLASSFDGTDIVSRGGDVAVIGGGRATLSRASLGRAVVSDADSMFTAVDVHFSTGTLDARSGVTAIDGARAELERARVLGPDGISLFAHNAELSLSDVEIVQAVDEHETERFAIHGDGTSRIEGTRLRIEGGPRYAVVLEGNTEATISDLEVRNVGSEGIVAIGPVTLELTRAAFSECGNTALFLSRGARVNAVDLRVSDTLAEPERGFFGEAISAGSGAQLTVLRGLFENNREASVLLIGIGTTGELREVSVVDTRLRECASTSCTNEPAGHGVYVTEGAALRMSDFEIARAASCGALVGAEGALDLERGVVSTSRIGVCLHAADYDRHRLANGVRYRDIEERNIAVSDIAGPAPPPEPIAPGS